MRSDRPARSRAGKQPPRPSALFERLEPRLMLTAVLDGPDALAPWVLDGSAASTVVRVEQAPVIQAAPVEVLPTTSAGGLAGSLGFNVDPNRPWQFDLAKRSGATEVRFQASWDKTENAKTGELRPGNLAVALEEARRLNLEVLVVAAYGSPRSVVGRFTVVEDAAAGARTLHLQEGLDAIVPITSHVQREPGGRLVASGKEAYYGALIHAVDTDAGTIELAAGLEGPLHAGEVLRINELRYPTAASDAAVDPSVQAYARYVRFLADTIAEAGVRGRVEVWNEPPWTNDRWDTRGAFYDDPPPGVLDASINKGFAEALRGDRPPTGVSYVWSGTHKSGFNSLLGGNLGAPLTAVEAERSFTAEAFHPYGNNPEDAAFDTAKLLSGVHFSEAALPGTNAGSNFKFARGLELRNRSERGFGLGQDLSETGLATSDQAQKARFNTRQLLTYRALGFDRINFYRLVDDGSGYGLSDRSGEPGQALESLTGLVDRFDAFRYDALSDAPLPDALTAPHLAPVVLQHDASAPLAAAAYTGRHTAEQQADSLAYALWQRTFATDAPWTELASPAAATAVLQLPFGQRLTSVENAVTGAAVAAEELGDGRLRVPVTDDPLILVMRPMDPDANLGPVARVAFDETATVGTPVAFDAGGSSDPDGVLSGFVWRFSDGVTLTGPRVERTFERPGEISFSLAVYDDGGRSDTLERSLRVFGRGGLDGTLTASYFEGISGDRIEDLTRSPRLNGPADRSVTLDRFETPEGVGNSFGAAVRGFLVPPATGGYTFYLAADDAAELRLSDDADPVGLRRIASVQTFTNPRSYDEQAGQRSDTVHLEAGVVYAIEALQKESGGGDHLAVAWSGPGLGGRSVIDGRFLSTAEPEEAEAPTAPEVNPGGDAPDAGAIPGGLGYAVYERIGGNDVASLAGSSRYPADPDITATLSRFEAPSGRGTQFGARLHGWIVPPETGVYRFHLAADDSALLRLSADADPAGAATIARVDRWTEPHDFHRDPAQSSTGLHLVAGRRYFVEALHKEGGGGDHLAVAWSGPAFTTPTVIDGSFLAAPADAGPPPTPVAPAPPASPDPGPSDPEAPEPPIESKGLVFRQQWEVLGLGGVEEAAEALRTGRADGGASLVEGFEAPANTGDGRAFVAAMQAWFTPEVSGAHRFAITADDQATLHLDPGLAASVDHVEAIARVNRWTLPGVIEHTSSQVSKEIELVAGRAYRLTALHAQTGGPNHLRVFWAPPGNDHSGFRPLEGVVIAAAAPADRPVSGVTYGASAFALSRHPAGPLPPATLPPLSASLHADLDFSSLAPDRASHFHTLWRPERDGSVQFGLAADDQAELHVRRVGDTRWRRAASVDAFTDPGNFLAGSLSLSVRGDEAWELSLWHLQQGGPGHASVGIRFDGWGLFEALDPAELRAAR